MERDKDRLCELLVLLDDFNSHAHVERDVIMDISFHGLVNFNSHAHVERDVMATVPTADVQDFNSHAHVERDDVKI